MIANLDTCPQVTWHSGEFVSITSKRPKFRDNQGGVGRNPQISFKWPPPYPKSHPPKKSAAKSIITMERDDFFFWKK